MGQKASAPRTSGLCNLDIASPRATFDCGTVLYGKGVWFHSITCHQNQIETLKGEVRRLQAESAEMQGTFDIIQAADMRAIELWHESHPGTELMQPSQGKLVSYLLGELDKYKAVVEAARAYWDWVSGGRPYNSDMSVRWEPEFVVERVHQYRREYHHRSMAIGKALAELEAKEMWEEVYE